MPNFIKIEETICGQTDVRSYACTDGHLRPIKKGHYTQLILEKGGTDKQTDGQADRLQTIYITFIVTRGQRNK